MFLFSTVGCGLFSSIFTKRTALSHATLTLGCFFLSFQMLESSSVPLFIVFILLFILLLIVLLIRRNGTAALIWNEIIREKVTNFIMNQSKEQRILNFVLQNAVRGDPCSVVDTIDKYCSQKEWAMNVGHEKGNCSRDQHLKDPSRLAQYRTSNCIHMATSICCCYKKPNPHSLVVSRVVL